MRLLAKCSIVVLLLAIGVVAIVWTLREGPVQPVRIVPAEDIKAALDSQRLTNKRLEAQQIIVTAKSLSDADISDRFKDGLSRAAAALQDSIKSGDEAGIDRQAHALREMTGIVLGARQAIEDATSFLSAFGAELSPALKAQIRQNVVLIRQAEAGAEWEELRQAGYKAADLNLSGPFRVKQIRELMETARNIGVPIDNPSSAFNRLLAPLLSALKADTWDNFIEQYRFLPENLKPPNDVFAAMRAGQRTADALGPTEAKELLASIASVRASLSGGNWQRVSEEMETLKTVGADAVRKYGANGIVALEAPCVRVLSIDGGGIRGMIPAMFLSELERRTQTPLAKLFDYIVGTSTGGILALGLTVPDTKRPGEPRYKASELVSLYEKEGLKIFPQRRFAWLREWLGPRYSADGIERVLREYFGERTLLGSALTNVVIPTYLLEEPKQARDKQAIQRHIFLRSYADESIFLYMWEVARAASAAPTYFPPFQIPLPAAIMGKGGGNDSVALIDAGVFANNPTAYALSTVREREINLQLGRLDRSKVRMLVVSLGTGQSPRPMSFERSRGWGLAQWAEPLANIAFSDPGTEDANRHLIGPYDYYFRLQPTISESIAALDNASRENIEALKQAAEAYIKANEQQFETMKMHLMRERPRECSEARRRF